jgi:hypothetical protein
MKRLGLSVLTVLMAWAFALGSLAASKPTEDELAEHWELLGATGKQPVMPGAPYGLKSLVINESLVYGERDWGINLKWDRQNRARNISFARDGGGAGPLKYGERVAMSVKDHGYVYYKQRDVGPNIGWSKQPKYEWEIRGGPAGEAVQTGVEISLWSAIEKDYLVYCERPLSVNLRWLKDKESKGCHGTWAVVKDKAKQAAKEAVREGAKKAVESHTGGEKP